MIESIQPILQWGIEFIKNIQSFIPQWLMNVIKIITHFGGPVFYVIVLLTIYLAVDEKRGFRLSWIIIFSNAINLIIKNTLQIPRPYILDSSVGGHAIESSFSTPSGHSQSSATFWSTIVLLFCKNLSKIAKISLNIFPVLLIGFTRICLGVHYPTDVLFGWLLGYCVAYSVYFLWEKFKTKFMALNKLRIPLIFAISYLLNMLDLTDTSMSATLFGVSCGYLLLNEKGGFNAKEGKVWQKILRIIIALILLALLYFGLKFIFQFAGETYQQMLRFIRYGIIGFSITFVVPKFCILLKIASPKQYLTYNTKDNTKEN